MKCYTSLSLIPAGSGLWSELFPAEIESEQKLTSLPSYLHVIFVREHIAAYLCSHPAAVNLPAARLPAHVCSEHHCMLTQAFCALEVFWFWITRRSKKKKKKMEMQRETATGSRFSSQSGNFNITHDGMGSAGLIICIISLMWRNLLKF